MSESSICSLTERVLLHSIVLDFLSPPRCEKIYLPFSRKSAIKSLVFADQLLCSTPERKWHWGVELIRGGLRVGFNSLVICFVSPLGILGFGAITFYSWGRCQVLTFSNRLEETDEERKKTEKYAQAFFADLRAFLIGGFFFSLGILWTFILLKRLDSFVDLLRIPLAGLAALVFFIPLGSIIHEVAISFLLHNSNRKKTAGLYLALALRKEFGLVEKDGRLLEYSEEDSLKCNSSKEGRAEWKDFTGWAHLKFMVLIKTAELELLSEIIKVQNYLRDEQKELLVYDYPIGTDRAVAHLRSQFFLAEDEKKLQVEIFVQRLTCLDLKASLLKKLHLAAQGWVAEISQKPYYYLGEKNYKEIFDAKVPFGIFLRSSRFKSALKLLNVKALEGEPQSLYDQFKAAAIRSKEFIEAGGEPYSCEEMLNLPEDCPIENIEKALEQFEIALHPENQPFERQMESQQLFDLLKIIKQMILFPVLAYVYGDLTDIASRALESGSSSETEPLDEDRSLSSEQLELSNFSEEESSELASSFGIYSEGEDEEPFGELSS